MQSYMFAATVNCSGVECFKCFHGDHDYNFILSRKKIIRIHKHALETENKASHLACVVIITGIQHSTHTLRT